MIDIKNMELYNSLPQYVNNSFQQYTNKSIVYKAMYLTGDSFWSSDIRNIIYDNFGVSLSVRTIGRVMSVMWEKGYVTRKKIQSAYIYTKTSLYHNKVKE